MGYIVFFSILSLAAIFDLCKREIPDWVPVLLICSCILTEDGVIISGIIPALILLIVGITAGGIGGGDIKVVAACGMVMGLWKTFAGLFISLCLLLLVHFIKSICMKIIKKKEIFKKEQAYPLFPFLLLVMLISFRFMN